MGAETFAIIGAGPAGLAAAYELAQRGAAPTLFEQDTTVGGLSKTVTYRGFRCDIGGHRFFTKNAAVEALWHEILPRDFLQRPRLSRIYYRGRLFHYPLQPLNALVNLGPLTSARVMANFAWRRLRPYRDERDLEHWVSNRFGDALYRIFFKTYTEKVWGIPCSEISADWAAQRIRNLDLGRAVLNALGIGRDRKVASLIERFDYPRLGPGQMYDALAEKTRQLGAVIHLDNGVAALRHDGRRIKELVLKGLRSAGVPPAFAVEHVVSTMPLTELTMRLDPQPPEAVLAAARALRYRSIITVNLLVRSADVLPDTWVYLHAPEIRAGRLQLYRNWSEEMVPDPAMSSLGFEYFVSEGDELWRATDKELVALATADLGKLQLQTRPAVEDAFVVRYAKAYPMYDLGYQERLKLIRDYLGRYENLACAGRYGQFRYNNMDHSILTGRLAARRLLGENIDPWAVNEEAEYHEERTCLQADRH